ncbi:serine hydrolase [Pseudoalteromonas luteoviolacea]|uniref:serine hydrolase n=1 Tax=Pseudoalteromonas luteoviolacea TaxID=43657 RepID=UPI001B362C5E|nr:serine hydrolase [Pseudoalteromonas luteoviolacea]
MKRFTLSILASAILLSGCNGDGVKIIKTQDKDRPAVLADFAGQWDMLGHGQIWSINESSLTTYNYNSKTCIKAETETAQDLKDALKYLSLSDSQDKLTFVSPASSNLTLSKLTSLPESCQDGQLTTEMTYPQLFDYVWLTLNEYYAFFELRGIDWQQVHTDYKPKVTDSMTQSEFIAIMDDIFTEFGDGHLSLSSDDGLSADGNKIDTLLKEALLRDDENVELAQAELNHNEFRVLKHLMQDGKLHTYEDSDALFYGKISERLGYVRIDKVSDMVADSSSDGIIPSVERDLANTDKIMEQVLTEFADVEAMIIDLRYNGGGYDNVSRKIAGYFTAEAYSFGSKQVSNKAHQGTPIELTVTPSESQRFTKPIYVLTGENTGSGGEVLAEALKALPHSKLVGEATNGSVSDSLTHELPGGWELSLSHQVYKNKAGEVLEKTGVTPDVLMPAYASVDHNLNTDTPIEFVIQTMDEVTTHQYDVAKLEESLHEALKNTGLPSLSVAVISGDQVVYEQAVGFADIAQNRLATVHTPYNVGSISKAVSAVAIMQQIEKGAVSLDDSVAEMNLTFDPNNPENSGDQITLRNLVTHTSGIKDSDMILCTYYVHETGLPLAKTFGTSLCDDPVPVTQDLETFLAHDYFNLNGRYVGSGIYYDEESGFPNRVLGYSNVGSALAVHAVEQKTGLDLAKDMQKHIFSPLKMDNTNWYHTNLKENNPKAIQYSIDSDGVQHALPEYSYATFYDGDLNVSSHDLSKLLIAIANNGVYDDVRILQQASVEKMLSAQSEVFTIPYKQGVFWYWDGSFFGHNGGDPGTHASMSYNKETRTGVIILANGEDAILGKNQIDSQLNGLASSLYRYGVQYPASNK